MTIVIIIVNLLCIAYMLTQRHRSPIIVWVVSLASLSGIALSLSPDITNDIAKILGVGRGADLLFYFWILISFFLIINVQLKLVSVNQNLTEIVRAMALHNALGGHTREEKISIKKGADFDEKDNREGGKSFGDIRQ